MTKGERLAQAALAWLGTPHINQAKVKGKGVDCGMLLIAALEDAGYIERDSIKVAPYSNEFHLHHSKEWYLETVQKYCEEIPSEKMAPGDFFMYKIGRCVSHGGIYIGGHNICHSVIGQGVIVSDLNDAMFFDRRGRKRLVGVYRFRGF